MTHETVDPDGGRYEFACRRCGTPYASKPEFCYECKADSISPIADVVE
ncbi:hypothetical protein [Natronorarus salvus]